MKSLSPSEEWARRMMEVELAATVKQHDDNSAASMFDFAIHHGNGSRGAAEVVAAADAEQIELWNVLYRDGRTQIEGIAGGWLLTVTARTRAKSLLQLLPHLLGQVEIAGIRTFDATAAPSSAAKALVDAGISSAIQSGTDFPGSVYFTIDEPQALFSDPQALVSWASDYFCGPLTQDVRQKLAASGAPERHVFVLLPGFTLAPAEAVDVLLQDPPVLPSSPLSLPAEFTHAWLASTWSFGHGLRWSEGARWTSFSKLQPDC